MASVACHDPSVPPTIPIAIYPVIAHSLALIEDILEFIETVLIRINRRVGSQKVSDDPVLCACVHPVGGIFSAEQNLKVT